MSEQPGNTEDNVYQGPWSDPDKPQDGINEADFSSRIDAASTVEDVIQVIESLAHPIPESSPDRASRDHDPADALVVLREIQVLDSGLRNVKIKPPELESLVSSLPAFGGLRYRVREIVGLSNPDDEVEITFDEDGAADADTSLVPDTGSLPDAAVEEPVSVPESQPDQSASVPPDVSVATSSATVEASQNIETEAVRAGTILRSKDPKGKAYVMRVLTSQRGKQFEGGVRYSVEVTYAGEKPHYPSISGVELQDIMQRPDTVIGPVDIPVQDAEVRSAEQTPDAADRPTEAGAEQEKVIKPGYRVRKDGKLWIVDVVDTAAGFVSAFPYDESSTTSVTFKIADPDLEIAEQGEEADVVAFLQRLLDQAEPGADAEPGPTAASPEPEPTGSTQEQPSTGGSGDGGDGSGGDGEGPRSPEKSPEQRPAIKSGRYSEQWRREELERFGMTEEQLIESVSGYRELTSGQRSLLIDNFQQLALARISEEAGQEHQAAMGAVVRSTGEAYRQAYDEIQKYGKVRRVIETAALKTTLALALTWRRLQGEFLKPELQKKAYDRSVSAGLEGHRETLTVLINGMREFGPGVEVSRKGELEFTFARKEDFEQDLTESEQKLLEAFNKASADYTRVPDHYDPDEEFAPADGIYVPSDDIVDSLQRLRVSKAHKKAAKRYQDARAAVLNGLTSVDEATRLQYVNDLELKIEANRFLSQHPDAEEALNNIEDDSALWAATKSVIRDRGPYFALGLATRSLAYNVAGVVAAPLVGAALGGFRERAKVKATLRERDALARQGVADTSDTALKMYRARTKPEHALATKDSEKPAREADLTSKLSRALERAQKETDAEKRSALVDQLITRLAYTEDKFNSKIVDFGATPERVANRYAFVQALARSRAYIATERDSEHRVDTRGSSIQYRLSLLDSGLKGHFKTMRDKRRELIKAETWRGVRKGAQYAVAGYLFGAGVRKGLRFAGELWDAVSSNEDVASGAEQVQAAAAAAEDAGAKAVHGPKGESILKPYPTPKEIDTEYPIHEYGMEQQPVQGVSGQDSTSADYRDHLPVQPPPGTQEAIEQYGDPDRIMTHADYRQNFSPEVPGGFSQAAVASADTVVSTASEGADGSLTKLPVEIRQGEGMIKAIARTLHEQYNLDPAKASEVANRLYAQETDEMHSLVHAGDRFTIEIKGMTASDMAARSAKEIAQAADYDPAHFDAASGIEPGVQEGTAPHGKSAETASPDHGVIEGPEAQTGASALHFADPATEKYFEDHGGHYDPETGKLSFNHDNRIEILHMKEHLDGYTNTLSVDEEGNYHITQVKGALKRVISFDPSGEVIDSPLPEEGTQVAAGTESDSKAAETAEKILTVEGRGSGRLARRISDIRRSVALLEVAHPGLTEKVQHLSALEAAGKKSDLIHYLKGALGISKSEATKLAKPMHYVFDRVEEGFRKGGAPLDDDDTIGSVLKRLHLKLKK